LLVELALERLPAGGKVIDLGTGSGAVAVAIAHQRPDLEVHATDISSPALEIAARNAARHQVPVRLHKSDWYSALADSGFDLIVSNPPYIHRDDPHLSQGDLRFEPTAALTDHGDGLSALRTIIRGADRFLKPGGWLLLEHGYDQAVAVRQILTDAGFAEVQSWKDLPGIERVSGGRREA
jgi:release factor glutamine methyltransferase